MVLRELVIGATIRIPLAEVEFRTARSSGPGGQNVNKVETKVELSFDVNSSRAFAVETRTQILSYLQKSGWPDGVIRLTAQRSRSQWQNKQDALKRLIVILKEALRPVRRRKPTRPTAASKTVRVERKRKRATIKRMRARPEASDE